MIQNKNSKYDVVAGLFQGIKIYKGDRFIVLSGLSGATNLLNLKFYNIMTIEEMQEKVKNMAFCLATSQDQADALTMVEAIYTGLKEGGFAINDDPEIIDLLKYTSVPKEYSESKTIDKVSVHSGSSGVGSFTTSAQTRYHGTGTTYTKAEIKKEPEPRYFERKNSKKPSIEELKIMSEKINLIMAGEYKVELPETKGEIVTDVKVADDDNEDYYNNLRNYHGCMY